MTNLFVVGALVSCFVGVVPKSPGPAVRQGEVTIISGEHLIVKFQQQTDIHHLISKYQCRVEGADGDSKHPARSQGE